MPEDKKIYVTLTGLPLSFELHWPFHKSTSGADFWVLHADVRLENSEGLHALAAVNLSATVREVMPSLEPKDAEGPVVNALRKEVDRRQVEFLKSAKLIPVHFSSRHYSFRQNKWVFGKSGDVEIATLLMRKIYWQTRIVGGDVWLGDETEAQYVENTADQLAHIAKEHLMDKGLIRMERRYATALPALMQQGEKFEAEMREALAELERKHAFERG
jgi:hypothetical protein